CSGLLIKSGVAIHDKTLFAFENEPYAQSLFGEVKCAYIDELLRAFDGQVGNRPPPTWNNIRLLDPDRDGFAKEHPFISALYSECESIIRRIVEQRKAEDTTRERVIRNRRLEKWLNSAMQKASRLFEDKLREIEEVPPIGPERAWKVGVTIVPPGEHRLAVGDRKVFSVVVNFGSPMPEGAAVAVRSDNPRAIRVTGSTAALRQDSTDPNIGRCTFAVQAVSAGAQSFVSAASNGYQDVVLIETLDPSETEPAEVPEGLSFDRRDYRVGHNKSKTLVLSYAGPVPTQELIASVASNHAGIQVRRPTCTLRPVGRSAVYAGRLSVTGRRLGARASVRASIGHDLRAEARVIVAEEKGGAGLRTPRLVDKEFGVMRVKWSAEDPALLEVACRHPAMAPYLGSPDADGRFPGEEREGFRAALAEAISEALAWRVIERRYQDPGLRADMTPTTYYTEYGSLMRDFLAIFHRGVAEDSAAAVASAERLPGG
ncbi:MAG: hypothetical protein NTU88_00790, partial [Armatimonadetes bacterium]|nr:hypothetical protein [Armatimonadota bacterium]